MPRSANGRRAGNTFGLALIRSDARRPIRTAQAYTISLDLDDPELTDALADRLEAHASLGLVGQGEAADIVIADDQEAPGVTLSLARPTDDALVHLPSDTDPDLILAVAHVLAAGYGIAAKAPLVGLPGTPDSAGETVTLTPRERDVVNLLVEGASNKHIARALDITERTAKFHVAAVVRKLGARNRSEAVAIVLRDGLVVL